MKDATARQTQTQSMLQNMVDSTETVSTGPGGQPDPGAADQPAGVLSDHVDALAADADQISSARRLIAHRRSGERKSDTVAAPAVETSLRRDQAMPNGGPRLRGDGAIRSPAIAPHRPSAMAEPVRCRCDRPARRRRRSATEHRPGERGQRIWLPAFPLPGYAELCLEHRDIDFGARLRARGPTRGIS